MSEYTEPQYCFLCHAPTSLCQCERTITDLDEYIDHLRETIERLSSEDELLREAGERVITHSQPDRSTSSNMRWVPKWVLLKLAEALVPISEETSPNV